ncbi:c-type cytochrome biogenesis protein CcmI [Uliginosibacterium gangwonense]|uniref:c-type cytochrome biogenesis protein CcmI n=1 Tax=Uliginosibacterium gangwonense TaxID=392736 RepID=UPI000362FDFA|nr:c-type cytochrome biogenesis protein CcmI [Uliginosibacterium gangwonense]
MIAFLSMVLILLAACLFVLLRPMLRRDLAVAPAPALAVNVLREQRRDLDAELAAGQINASEHANGVAELERRLVAESVESKAVTQAKPHRILALALAIILPLGAGALYLALGNPAALNPANLVAEQTVTPAQIEGMVAKLEAKVKANPDDLEGVRMLARSYMVLGRPADAIKIYSGLADKLPDDASVYADWADAAASAQNGKFAGEPDRLIAKALALDPKNVKALALAGSAAYDAQDFKAAIELWGRMAALVDPQSEMGQAVQAMLSDARAKLGMPPSAANSTPVAVAPALTATGQVSLAPALKAKAAPEDAVFIFARNPAGGPPLAAMRFKVADLPLEFDFSKAQSMMGASPQGKVVIAARISKSGNATPNSGDLQGKSVEVAPDAQGVKVLIDGEVN